MDDKETLHEMWKDLKALAGITDRKLEISKRLEELKTTYMSRTTLIQVLEGGSRAISPRLKSLPAMLYSTATDKVCHWTVKSDGESDPVEFVERIEDLCKMNEL